MKSVCPKSSLPCWRHVEVLESVCSWQGKLLSPFYFSLIPHPPVCVTLHKKLEFCPLHILYHIVLHISSSTCHHFPTPKILPLVFWNSELIVSKSLKSSCHSTSNASSVSFNSVQSLSLVRLFATPWAAARQASLSLV